MRTFIYSFRTNKFIEELESLTGKKIFVINKPNIDLPKISQLNKGSTDLILGIGIVKHRTKIEKFVVNNFHGHLIDKEKLLNEKQEIKMLEFSIAINDIPSNSFCNQSAYKIGYELGFDRIAFIHLNPKDITTLSKML